MKNRRNNFFRRCWGTCHDNSLNGRVTPEGEPRSSWWIYERYGRMTGSSVMTVPGGETLDVVASQDVGVAYALVGRYKDSYITYRDTWITVNHPDVITPGEVLLQNLDDVPSLVFGNKVHVVAELIKNSEQAAADAPVVMINADFTVVNGQLILSLPNFGTFDAYALILTPPSGILPGDYNGDGHVNAADYVVLRTNNGSDAAYAVWRSNFGRSQAAAAAVPEPSTLPFCVIAAALLAFYSRSR